MPLPTYLKRSSQLAISFVAALYITFHGRSINFGEAILCWDFYISLVPSVAAAYGMIWLIQTFMIWLDGIVLWTDKFLQRLVLQIVLGIILPSLFDLLLFYILFTSTGRDIVESGFLLVDYPIVVAFVILMNMLLVVLFYRHLHKRALESGALTVPFESDNFDSNEVPENKDEQVVLEIEYYGRSYQLDVVEDIIMFATVNKQVRVFTLTNKSYPINLSLASLREKYTSLKYCQISRGVIINMSFVTAYKIGEKRDTLELALDENMLKLIPNSTYLIVTKDNITTIESFFRK
ncbi:LytTR family transcriptional regulator [Flavobacterium supellecticarium]|uniref:LytTR family transcriptional regulator n=1 Tax=Flavobacterium supellecticarium TaxID=2565924 RepID=A0A4S4A3J8_9FLAO|nr:LytTR family DNA-binding domain-containing protein [Flavobacterium supellecticarium]THF53004.1 LytTR family transcriptional regulator [Flavobacterium supellecticarium]